MSVPGATADANFHRGSIPACRPCHRCWSSSAVRGPRAHRLRSVGPSRCRARCSGDVFGETLPVCWSLIDRRRSVVLPFDAASRVGQRVQQPAALKKRSDRGSPTYARAFCRTKPSSLTANIKLQQTAMSNEGLNEVQKDSPGGGFRLKPDRESKLATSEQTHLDWKCGGASCGRRRAGQTSGQRICLRHAQQRPNHRADTHAASGRSVAQTRCLDLTAGPVCVPCLDEQEGHRHAESGD